MRTGELRVGGALKSCSALGRREEFVLKYTCAKGMSF